MDFVLISFSCFNIEIAYSNSLSVASLSSHEKCPNFRKTSTPRERGGGSGGMRGLIIAGMSLVDK